MYKKSRRIKSIVLLQIMVNRKQDILFIIMIYIMRILKEDVIRIVHGEDGQLYFTSSGKARKDTNALLKMRVMNLVSRLTTSEMSKNQKLHACWEYIVDDAGFQYGGSDPVLKKAGWCRKTALSMLNTKVGNCYGFASTLAAFAKELGYKKIELIDGRTPGTRDHAPDGLRA